MSLSLASHKTLAIMGLLATNILWAGNIYVSRIVIESVPPFSLNLIRWLIACLILTPFLLQETLRHQETICQNWKQLTLFGFLGVTVYNAFLYTAAYTTSGINIAVISTLSPVITFFFVWLFLRIKPNRNQLIGLSFGLLGVLVLVMRGDINRIFQLQFVVGDLWMLAAVVSWAIYTALVKNKPPLPSLVFLYITLLLGTTLAIPGAIIENVNIAGGVMSWLSFDAKSILIYLYVGIFPSILAYFLFNYGTNVLGPNVAATFAYLLPVFTALISIFWLNEVLHWFHFIGQLLVFFGFYFSFRRSGLSAR